MDYKEYIDKIPNFPIEGITYRDIQPLLANHTVFMDAIKDMGNLLEGKIPDYWIALESRGFLFASALSMLFGGGVRLIRKKGKLGNNKLMSVNYGLEYGKDSFEMAYLPQFDLGKVVIVDDVYATGGTMSAAQGLCEKLGYEVSDKLCLMDIGIVKDHDVKCLISYE
jgi:adenine phosphoribosyltransferase